MEGYFDQYEYVSLIVPGAVALGWYAVRSGKVKDLLGLKDISLGGLGAMVIMAYLAGHLVAVVGTGLETAVRSTGQFPTDRIIRGEEGSPFYKDENAKKKINANIKGILHSSAVFPNPDMTDKDRRALSRGMYDAVAAAGKARFIDIFNRTYGFLRNVTGALLFCAALSLLEAGAAERFRAKRTRLWIFAGFLALAIGTFWRMTFFSSDYAHELFIQFMRLP